MAFQRSYTQRLDRLQRKLLAIVFSIRPQHGESWDDYALRRRMESSALARKSVVWSREWAKAVCSWSDHLQRGQDAQAWTPTILGWRDGNWLALQRLTSSSGTESRLRSRIVRGRPLPRWEESIALARARTV